MRSGKGHVVESVNAEHLLGNVRRAGDVAAVGRHVEGPGGRLARVATSMSRDVRMDVRAAPRSMVVPRNPKSQDNFSSTVAISPPVACPWVFTLTSAPSCSCNKWTRVPRPRGRMRDLRRVRSGSWRRCYGCAFGGFSDGDRVVHASRRTLVAFADATVRATVDLARHMGALWSAINKSFMSSPGARSSIVSDQPRGFLNNHLPAFHFGEVKRVRAVNPCSTGLVASTTLLMGCTPMARTAFGLNLVGATACQQTHGQ